MTQLAQSRAEHEKQLATAGEEDLQPVQEGPLEIRKHSITEQSSLVTTCGVGTGVGRRRHEHGARLVIVVVLQGDHGGQLGA